MSEATSVDCRPRVHSFLWLRRSLCAALGLSVAACGGNVTVPGGSGGGGDGGGDGGGGNGGGSTSTGTVTHVCDGAQPILQENGTDSGYVLCSDGSVDRAFLGACAPVAPACTGNETLVSCSSDADCTAKPNGKCGVTSYVDFGGGGTSCECLYPCTTDKDCGPDAACLCAGVGDQNVGYATCVPATCKTNADCAGGECGAWSFTDGCSTYYGLTCRTAQDTCRTDAVCTNGDQCAAPGTSWGCQQVGCVIGRPLFVEGEVRKAASAPRRDWTLNVLPSLEGLPAETRAALAEHHALQGAMEHASVASFSRFSLELMALGAPPDLLGDAARAAIDEVAHAQIAYALASAYAGKPVGPGPLDVSGVVPSTDRAAIVEALVAEACVGETVGAAEAAAIAQTVTDPVLREIFGRIAEDEARHAALGWRTLAWLLNDADPALRDLAARTMARHIALVSSPPPALTAIVDPDHGLFSPAMLAAVRAQAVRDVVVPCANDVGLSPRQLAPAA